MGNSNLHKKFYHLIPHLRRSFGGQAKPLSEAERGGCSLLRFGEGLGMRFIKIREIASRLSFPQNTGL